MIRSRQLAYQYASGPALRFDDADVPQGGLLLLSGASGSGKSTWLALAAGLLAPTSGDIAVAGQALGALSQTGGDAWRAKNVGFLPQKLHLSAALTVHQNLSMAQWAAGQGEDDGRIAEALAALDVQELAARKPSQLSGGAAGAESHSGRRADRQSGR
jgi:putative ABC transport system ATP-binding protein